tara:strand:- start:3828 stop:4046 length:219 start_codon:yes stop_codon:yes gene_type:complete
MDDLTLAFTASGIAGFFLLFAGYLGLKRRAKNDAITNRRAERAGDAAERVGGYDNLIALEQERRRQANRQKS